MCGELRFVRCALASATTAGAPAPPAGGRRNDARGITRWERPSTARTRTRESLRYDRLRPVTTGTRTRGPARRKHVPAFGERGLRRQPLRGSDRMPLAGAAPYAYFAVIDFNVPASGPFGSGIFLHVGTCRRRRGVSRPPGRDSCESSGGCGRPRPPGPCSRDPRLQALLGPCDVELRSRVRPQTGLAARPSARITPTAPRRMAPRTRPRHRPTGGARDTRESQPPRVGSRGPAQPRCGRGGGRARRPGCRVRRFGLARADHRHAGRCPGPCAAARAASATDAVRGGLPRGADGRPDPIHTAPERHQRAADLRRRGALPRPRPGQGDRRRRAPAAREFGPFPLIVFGHGFDVTPSVYARLLQAWTRAGYVVASPVFA